MTSFQHIYIRKTKLAEVGLLRHALFHRQPPEPALFHNLLSPPSFTTSHLPSARYAPEPLRKYLHSFREKHCQLNIPTLTPYFFRTRSSAFYARLVIGM